MALYLLSILLFYGISTTRAVNRSQNIAYRRPTEQSSTVWGGSSDKAVDGNTDGYYVNNSVTHTRYSVNPWWKVDLEEEYNIAYIQVFNRQDACCLHRLANFFVEIIKDGRTVWSYTHTEGASLFTHIDVTLPVLGDQVKVSLYGKKQYLSLAEVQVQKVLPPLPWWVTVYNIAYYKPTSQSSTAYGGLSGKAVDRNTNGNYWENGITHTELSFHPWWRVDLGNHNFKIAYIRVFGRLDCCSDRLVNFRVRISHNRSWVHVFTQTGPLSACTTIDLGQPVLGNRVEVSISGKDKYLSLAEVEVFSSYY